LKILFQQVSNIKTQMKSKSKKTKKQQFSTLKSLLKADREKEI